MKVGQIIIYRCDICGKEGTDNYVHYKAFFGRGYDGFDYTFNLCSNECSNHLSKLDNKALYKIQNDLENRQDLPFKRLIN